MADISKANVVIIDSGGANISSVQHALARLDVQASLTADADSITKADYVILPGVGAAADAMAKLKASELTSTIRSLTQPVLGICLGMQLLFGHSAEGDVDLLGLAAGDIERFANIDGHPVPHMGWNNVTSVNSDHPLVAGIDEQSYFYFVHSYRAPVTDQTLAACEYGEHFTAITANDNFMGCQFHPERSSKAGSRILQNFLSL